LEFLLELPVLTGLAIFISFISLSGIIVVVLSKKMMQKSIQKEHEKVGRLLFRVSAGLIALLVSLSYANERVRQSKIIDSMEEEASLLVNVSMKLTHLESIEAKNAFGKIKDYVALTINDDWKIIENDPYFSRISQSLVDAHLFILKIPAQTESEIQLKTFLISEINEIIKLQQIRIYSHNASTPYLIYILLCGLTFMWIFYSVYKVNTVSLFFLTLYNILIAILIYFVFTLSNPLIGPLKIKPDSFIIVQTKGFEMYRE